MTVQYCFACIKLQAAKGFVAIVQVQLLVQQLAPIMRHNDVFASVSAQCLSKIYSAALICHMVLPFDHSQVVQEPHLVCETVYCRSSALSQG